MRPPAAFSNVERQGRSPSKIHGGVWGRGAAAPRMLYLYSDFTLQYSQIHRLYQDGWSFSISRYTSYTEMVGPSVFPEKQVIPKWLVLQYFQPHRLYQNRWSFSISRYTSYTKMTGFSVFPDSQVLKTVGFSLFPGPYNFSHLFHTIFTCFSHFKPEFQFQPPQKNGYYKI